MGFYHEIWRFPVKFRSNQSNDNLIAGQTPFFNDLRKTEGAHPPVFHRLCAPTAWHSHRILRLDPPHISRCCPSYFQSSTSSGLAVPFLDGLGVIFFTKKNGIQWEFMGFKYPT